MEQRPAARCGTRSPTSSATTPTIPRARRMRSSPSSMTARRPPVHRPDAFLPAGPVGFLVELEQRRAADGERRARQHRLLFHHRAGERGRRHQRAALRHRAGQPAVQPERPADRRKRRRLHAAHEPTNGISILTGSSTPPLVPGATYYLGVQNTNNFTVQFTLEVNFQLTATAITNYPISGVIFTNMGGKRHPVHLGCADKLSVPDPMDDQPHAVAD